MIEVIGYIIGGLVLVVAGLIKAIKAMRDKRTLIARIPIKEIRKHKDAEYKKIEERYDEIYQPDSDISATIQRTIDDIRKRREKD